LRLNELAIALSEELTLEAEEIQKVKKKLARIGTLKDGRLTSGSTTCTKLIGSVPCATK
jgi:hypothetical protein